MSDHSRRDVLRTLALLGAAVPVWSGRALAETPAPAGKEQLRVLNDRPLNAETPVTLLDPEVTPTDRHFVRNNGLLGARASSGDLAGWTLAVEGEVDTPLSLSLDQLKRDFPEHTARLVLECGGNGRAGFFPPAKGNQWTLGAVGCAEWTGVRLKDVLDKAGVKDSAVYLAYYGEDRHPSGDPEKVVISRGVPIAKALDGHCMLAWAMNGAPLPALHGFPLRLVCPGYPASASGKWLTRLIVRDVEHDGPKMTGLAYRVPKHPVEPGAEVSEADMRIIEQMPVKSIITAPKTGGAHALGAPLGLRGHAWSGAGDVAAVHVSLDFGATWQQAELEAPANRYAWQRWRIELEVGEPGYYEVWARATDHTGAMQPMVVPGWNPKGYLNNAMQRISVRVG